MYIEKMIKLLRQCCQLGAVRILDTGGTHNRLEELSLQDHLTAGVDIIRLNTQSLVQLLDILFLLFLFTATLVVIAHLDPRGLARTTLGLIDEVKLVDFSSTEQGEMILPTLVVYAIELRQAAVSSDDVSVA